MPRKRFFKSLDKLNTDMIEMATMTEKAIDNSLLSLDNHDLLLSKEVVNGDRKINEKQAEIETNCMRIIAIQQPVAGDIRLIISVLKMTTDVERIADHASDISSLVLKFGETPYDWDISPLHQMAERVKGMLKDAISAFITRDLPLAENVWGRDIHVNELFDSIVSELTAKMEKEPSFADQCVKFLLIAKYLERIGDHTKNLSEWVIYSVTGEFLYDTDLEPPETSSAKVSDAKMERRTPTVP